MFLETLLVEVRLTLSSSRGSCSSVFIDFVWSLSVSRSFSVEEVGSIFLEVTALTLSLSTGGSEEGSLIFLESTSVSVDLRTLSRFLIRSNRVLRCVLNSIESVVISSEGRT